LVIDEKLAQIDLSKFCTKRDIDLFDLRKLRKTLAKIGQNVFAKNLLRKSQKKKFCAELQGNWRGTLSDGRRAGTGSV
jgi:hypothetical protein